MLALNAEFRVVGPLGTRTIAADDFFLDILTTALGPNEMLTEVRIPTPGARSGGSYSKFRHPASGYALIGVAAQISVGAEGTIRDARVAVTGVGTRATRARATERALVGKTAGDVGSVAGASMVASEGLEFRAEAKGSVEYQQHCVTVYARRAIARAIERAAGS